MKIAFAEKAFPKGNSIWGIDLGGKDSLVIVLPPKLELTTLAFQ
jgi:hypothetical protein